MTVNGELRPENPFQSSGNKYLQAGWHPFPLPTKQKYPPPAGTTGWRGIDLTSNQVDSEMRKGSTRNVGIRMPASVIGIDIDSYGDKSGGKTLYDLEGKFGVLPPAPILTSRDDGTSGIRFFRLPGDEVLVGYLGHGIEVIQRHHRYAVAAPSLHPKTKSPYRWLNPDRSEATAIPNITSLPMLPNAWVNEFKAAPRKTGGPVANSGMVQVWLDSHEGLAACSKIQKEIDAFEPNVGSRHDTMLVSQLSIVNLGAQGHDGATHGLDELRTKFLAKLGNDRDGDSEWYEALAGAVGIITANPPTRTGCCPSPTGLPQLQNEPNPAEAPDYFFDKLANFPPLRGTFRFGGMFVWVPRINERGYKEPVDKEDSNGPAMIQPLDALGICAFVNERVWLYDLVKQGKKLVPIRTTGNGWDILARRAPFSESIPQLRSVTHTPVLRADGTILNKPGYDAQSKIAYMPPFGLKVPPIPDQPTQIEVSGALQLLLDIIGEFPWLTTADRNNYLAMWLTPLLLPYIEEAGPIGILDAPMMGSGKSLLSKILGNTHGAVLRGRLPSESEETRKQITTILTQTTAPVVVWDNLSGTVNNEYLASLVTKNTWTDRVLGFTKEVSVPSKRLYILNGNNVTLGGDMGRRGIWASIDPNMPKPWERTGFKYEAPDRWVAVHQGEVLASLLTLIRAWIVAGSPTQTLRSDSFTEWFQTINGIFSVIGLDNVGQTEKDQVTDGEEDSELEEFLTALFFEYKHEPFFASDAAKACASPKGGFSELGHSLPRDLHDKFVSLNYQGAPFAKNLGWYFKRTKGRWGGNYCVRPAKLTDDKYRERPAWVIHYREPGSRLHTPGSPGSPGSPRPSGSKEKDNSSSSSSSSSLEQEGPAVIGERGEHGVPGQSMFSPPTGVPLAFDFETPSVDRLWKCQVDHCFARLLSVSDGKGVWTTTDPAEMRSWLTEASVLVGHNALGYDVFVANRYLDLDFEMLISKTIDTKVLARLVEPPASMTDENGKHNAQRLNYHLDDLAQRRCGAGKAGNITELANKHFKINKQNACSADKFELIPVDDPEFVQYARMDAEITWNLYADLDKHITDKGYADREMELARETARIVHRGFAVDLKYLEQRIQEDEKTAVDLRKWLETKLGPIGKRLGDQAKEKLGAILESHGVEVLRTATGKICVDKEFLSQFKKGDHEVNILARAVLALNGDRGLPVQVSKWLGTDNRVHPYIDMCSQASGRWSVTNPGLTTFGKRSESLLADRDLFCAREGHILYARDLSNIDVRGMAALSQDEEMIARLQPGLELDWHEQVADIVWGDPRKREQAKSLAHAINYNCAAPTIAEHAGIPVAEASKIITTLNTRFPKLAEFKRQVVAKAQSGGEITNGWGRVLNVSVNRSFTQAPGLSGQSWARDAVMECLLRLRQRDVSRYVVAHIHDEFIFEIPEDRYDEVVAKIADAMTFERDGVPVISDASKGSPAKSWGDLYRRKN